MPEPRAQPQPEVEVLALPASEQASYRVETVQGEWRLSKDYLFETKDTNRGKALVRLAGKATLTIDPQSRLVREVRFDGDLAAHAEPERLRMGVSYSCRLLDGDEKTRALIFPTLPPTPMITVTEREVRALLKQLESDPGGRRRACEGLFRAAPLRAPRGLVARALEARLEDQDAGVRAAAIRALGVWGDDDTRGLLIERLEDRDLVAHRVELIEALGRLGPDAEVAEALVDQLGEHPREAGRALRAQGPLAEGPLIAAAREAGPPATRAAACEALGAIGTSRAVPTLRELAAVRSERDLIKAATEAVKVLADRTMDEDQWQYWHRGLAESPNTRVCREAAEHLRALDVTDARREAMVLVYTHALRLPDDRLRRLAVQGLGRWGDDESRDVLIEAIADPGFRPWREALEALGELGLKADAIDALEPRMREDWKAVFAAFERIGSPAEGAVARVLAGTDFFARTEACRLLARIGTAKSIEPLQAASQDPNGFVRRDADAALKQLRARLEGPPARLLNGALAELASNDGGRIRAALDQLAAYPVVPEYRSRVARSVEPLVAGDVPFVQESACDVLARWDDDQTRALLAALVATPARKNWGDAAVALARLGADARGLRAIVGRLKDDANRAGTALRIAGRAAEPVLLDFLRQSDDPRARVQACRLLADLGGPESLPILEPIAARESEMPVAEAAERALHEIEPRP